MGTSPADTEREIGHLRGDMTAALDELERRLRGGLRGIASSEARITSGRAADDMAQRARQNPSLVAVVGVVAVAAVGYGVYSAVKARRESSRPQNKLKRRIRDVREEVRGRLEEKVEASRRQLERAKQSTLLVKLDPEGSGYMRIVDARLDTPLDKNKGRQEVIKKLVWAGLLSVFMAVGSVVARRVAGGVWKATVREDPPTERNRS